MGKTVGNIDHHGSGKGPRRTGLVSKGGAQHSSQPHKGDDTGAGHNGVAEHHRGHTMQGKHSPGGSGIFTHPFSSNAWCFPKQTKSGVLRTSGHSGAHQVGKRK